MRLYYSHPLDNLLETAVDIELRQGVLVSVSNGLDKLYDWDPSDALMIVGTTIEIIIDHGSAVAMGLIVPWLHSTIDVAGKVQRDSSDTFGGGPYPVDVDISAPTINGRGLFSAPWADLSAEDPYQYTRLYVTGNGYPITIGFSFLGKATRYLSVGHYGHGARGFGRRGDVVIHPTVGNLSLRYERAVGSKSMDGTIAADPADLALIDNLRDLVRDGARPIIVVPKDTVQDAWIAHLSTESLDEPIGGSEGHLTAMPVMQLSHSLPWIDADAL
jgi:hypothetical protein